MRGCPACNSDRINIVFGDVDYMLRCYVGGRFRTLIQSGQHRPSGLTFPQNLKRMALIVRRPIRRRDRGDDPIFDRAWNILLEKEGRKAALARVAELSGVGADHGAYCRECPWYGTVPETLGKADITRSAGRALGLLQSPRAEKRGPNNVL